ncbi:Fc receptor-like protein 5 [Taeniopygia guttata]|uniref:Fc receptor-like protein 5 n=1 Tax=Taeniopygia guttata TaxID=59729 RepID=UPI003BB85BD4
MALRSFIPFLAFLPILFPPVAPSDLLLPAPNISVTPPKSQFLIGDAVSISCSAPPPPRPDRLQGFRFTGTSGWVTDVLTSRNRFVHTFTVTGPRDGGFHACSYTVLRRGGGHLRSLTSRAVLIDVRDRPSQPNLTVEPSSVTVEGQPLVFSCAAPPGAAERRFGFFQEELEVTDGIWEGSGSDHAQLRVEKSDRNRTGNFSCRYEEMTEGRWIASYASDAVQVIVKGPCPAPLLSVEPPSGAVAAGHRLRLTCAAPRRRFRRRFRFFRDGAEVAPGADDVIGDVTEEGAELLFPRISPELAGNFSCRVEEEVGGAWLEAPPSRGVAVVVRAQFEFLPLVIGGVVGVASLLLGLLLAAWLCRRKRGGSRWRGLSPGDENSTFPMGDYEVAA